KLRGGGPEMLKVSDIMTRAVHVLSPETTLEDAAWEFSENKLSGAPVLDKAGHVVGVISKTDLVGRGPGATSSPVRAAMTPLVFWVRPEDPAMVAVRIMVTERVHRVIVIGEGGRLAGIVTSMDILAALETGAEMSGGPAAPRRHAKAAQAIPDGWMAELERDH